MEHITIPAVATNPPVELVSISVPIAAAHVISAWSADQTLKGLHEASHCVAAAALGWPIRAVDLRGQSWAHVELDEDVDSVPLTLTASRAFDRMVIDLAGRAGDIAVLGQPTTSSAADLENATRRAINRAAAGADPGAPLLSPRAFGPFGAMDLPDFVRDEFAKAVMGTLEDCAREAERLVNLHLDQVKALAIVLTRERRLSDDALQRALVALGLEPAPLLG